MKNYNKYLFLIATIFYSCSSFNSNVSTNQYLADDTPAGIEKEILTINDEEREREKEREKSIESFTGKSVNDKKIYSITGQTNDTINFDKEFPISFNQRIRTKNDLKDGEKYLLAQSPILTTHDKETYKKLRSKTSVSILYFADSYNVQDPANLFNQTFGDKTNNPASAHRYGYLMFYMDKKILKQNFLYAGFDLGFSHSTGFGIFNNSNTLSNAQIKFWIVPFEPYLKLNIDLGYVSLFVLGGPSIVWLSQSRTDMNTSESNQTIRQIGYGYHYGTSLNINLSKISPALQNDLRLGYGISDMFLSLYFKHQNYLKFVDPITISGNAFGLGFSFEYF